MKEKPSSSIEEKIILLCSRTNVDSSIQKTLLHILPNYSPDWGAIIKTSNQHNILPFLYYNLNKANLLGVIPEDIGTILKNSYYSNVGRNVKLFEELSFILKSINDASLTIILLKGVILAEELYHNPGLRAMTDIDILVKEDELDKIKNILLQSGYRENTEEVSNNYYKKYLTEFVFTKRLSSNLYFYLEAHTALVPPRPYRIILPCLWEKMQEKTLYGERARFLSWEDTLFSLALHLRRHTRRLSLKFIIDIAELLNSHKDNLDWDYINKMALKNHVITTLYFALYISKELLGTSISVKVIDRFKPCIAKDKLICLCINKDNFLAAKKWRGVILRILLFDRIIDLALYLWRVIFLERLIVKTALRNLLRPLIKKQRNTASKEIRKK